MPVRTVQTIVNFTSGFMLPGLDAPQPAGSYRIDHDEETIEGVSYIGWRRLCTFIHLPGIGTKSAKSEMVPINQVDLDEALAKDTPSP